MCRTLHLVTAGGTFFSSPKRTFSNTDHLLDYKTNLNKFKREIIKSIFADHSGIKRQMTERKVAGKSLTI